jgi:hypothetical protein
MVVAYVHTGTTRYYSQWNHTPWDNVGAMPMVVVVVQFDVVMFVRN